MVLEHLTLAKTNAYASLSPSPSPRPRMSVFYTILKHRMQQLATATLNTVEKCVCLGEKIGKNLAIKWKLHPPAQVEYYEHREGKQKLLLIYL